MRSEVSRDLETPLERKTKGEKILTSHTGVLAHVGCPRDRPGQSTLCRARTRQSCCVLLLPVPSPVAIKRNPRAAVVAALPAPRDPPAGVPDSDLGCAAPERDRLLHPQPCHSVTILQTGRNSPIKRTERGTNTRRRPHHCCADSHMQDSGNHYVMLRENLPTPPAALTNAPSHSSHYTLNDRPLDWHVFFRVDAY